MKKGLWYIFKCQNCGKVFQEKAQRQDLFLADRSYLSPGVKRPAEIKEYARHIGAQTHLVATHRCKPEEVYGAAKLIGCQIWGTEIIEAED